MSAAAAVLTKPATGPRFDAFDHQMIQVAARRGRVIVYATDGESHVEATLLSWRPRVDRRDPTSPHTDQAIVEWVRGLSGRVQCYLLQPVESIDRDSGFMVQRTSYVVENVVCDPPSGRDHARWERKMLKWLASHDIAAMFDGDAANRYLVVPGIDKHIPIGQHRRLVYAHGRLSAPPPLPPRRVTASAHPAAQTRQDATK